MKKHIKIYMHLESTIETEGFIGYTRYEEYENPTLFYIEDGKAVFKYVEPR